MRHKPYTKDIQKIEDSVVQHITIFTVGFNRNTPNIRPLGHHLAQEYLQSQHHNLHSCGGCRIRTGGIMSPPSKHN
jgi:hypothetical protein